MCRLILTIALRVAAITRVLLVSGCVTTTTLAAVATRLVSGRRLRRREWSSLTTRLKQLTDCWNRQFVQDRFPVVCNEEVVKELLPALPLVKARDGDAIMKRVANTFGGDDDHDVRLCSTHVVDLFENQILEGDGVTVAVRVKGETSGFDHLCPYPWVDVLRPERRQQVAMNPVQITCNWMRLLENGGYHANAVPGMHR